MSTSLEELDAQLLNCGPKQHKFAVSLDQAAAVNLLHEVQEAAKELSQRVDAALPHNTQILVHITIYDGEKSPELLEAAKTLNWPYYQREGTEWFSMRTAEPEAQVTIFYEHEKETA